MLACPIMMKRESFPVAKIYVPTERRKTLDPARVGEIAESMLKDGQQTPIKVRADGARIMSGVNWTMLALPQLHGTLDKVRLDQGLRVARQHYGSCIRAVPPDWPATHLPPLPKGIAPGLLWTAPPPWQAS